jgi:hypothetical protein
MMHTSPPCVLDTSISPHIGVMCEIWETAVEVPEHFPRLQAPTEHLTFPYRDCSKYGC